MPLDSCYQYISINLIYDIHDSLSAESGSDRDGGGSSGDGGGVTASGTAVAASLRGLPRGEASLQPADIVSIHVQ